MKVLIIENEEFFAENLCRCLKINHQIDIQFVTRVEAALKLIKATNFNLIISDISLPDSMTTDWLLEIGKINSGQKLVIISSYQIPRNIEESPDLDIIGYFEKPFDVQHVKNLITNYLI